jgi:hypothetical protein
MKQKMTLQVSGEQLLVTIHQEEDIHFIFDEELVKLQNHKKQIYDTINSSVSDNSINV